MASLGPLPNVPQTLKIRFIYSYNLRPAINVFYVSFTGAIADLAAMGAILSQIQTAWSTNVRPLMSSQVTLTGIEGTDLTTRTGVVAMNTTGGAGSGPATNPLPNSVALCVSLPVAFRYRGGHSRMYLPGQSGTNSTNQINWTSTWLTTVGNGMVNFRTAINAMTGPNAPHALVQVSYFQHDADHKPIYHPSGPVVRPITGVLVHSRIDSQRRRLGKETT